MVNPAFGTSSAQSIDDIEIDALYKAFDNELLSWKSVIDDRHKGEKAAKGESARAFSASQPPSRPSQRPTLRSSDPGVVMQITLINCVYNYCRLVICCCGMQLMTKRPSKKPNELFAGCVQAATTLVKLMVEDFAPTGFIRYFPELIYVHAAFAAVVLMKCLRPEFNALLDIQQEERIIELVKKLFEAWASEKMSTDEKQNTQLYARFLKQLMDPHIARLDARKSSATQRNGQAHTNGHNPVSFNQSISSISTSLFPGLPRQDPAATLGNLYPTGLDATKAAVELAAAGMMPNGNGTWDQFFPPADGSGINLPDMSVPWSGSMAGGMNADECLATMMGLGNETWFL
ncbi:hypothetical protein VTO73DRAFT_4421 [Trametes versicolor]